MTEKTFTFAGRTMTLTTEHAASSYGIPVLVSDGIAHGRRDMVELPVKEEAVMPVGSMVASMIVESARYKFSMDHEGQGLVNKFLGA